MIAYRIIKKTGRTAAFVPSEIDANIDEKIKKIYARYPDNWQDNGY